MCLMDAAMGRGKNSKLSTLSPSAGVARLEANPRRTLVRFTCTFSDRLIISAIAPGGTAILVAQLYPAFNTGTAELSGESWVEFELERHGQMVMGAFQIQSGVGSGIGCLEVIADDEVDAAINRTRI